MSSTGLLGHCRLSLLSHVAHPKVKADTHTLSTCDLSSIEKILTEVDQVPTTLATNRHADLVVLEDNDAVIKMCEKGRCPAMRHVARTHRIDLDWLFERLLHDPAIKIRYIDTKLQLADMFTKGAFSELQWKQILSLIHIKPAKGELPK